jgi:two-component system, chemotaxis family, protein-glutamate methylesterase/glutaminase
VSQQSSTALKFPNTAFDVVAIACSAGGLRALSALVSMLPENFPAAVLVVQHLSPRYPSLLTAIIRRRTTMMVREAHNGDVLRPATIYIAPPRLHMVILPGGIVSLTDSELVHFVRPSGDVLFKSVAEVCGRRAIAVILTGTGVDGTDGAQVIKQMGGTVIAQNEATSEYFGMPNSVINAGNVDLILPLPEISMRLQKLVSTEPGVV